ncbi:MAG: NnrU family protein [Bacteroidia bacterium]
MILLIVSWVLYYSLHSLLASNELKTWSKKRLGSNYRYYRLGFNFISLAGFAAIAVWQISLPSPALITQNLFLTGAGIFLILAGMMTGYIAFSAYDTAAFIGFTQEENPASPPQLITSGLNRYVRHPLYFATILLLAGFLLVSFKVKTAAFVSVSLVYLVVGTMLEEKKLEQTFGEAYQTYKQEVKMFIPFII